MDKKLYGKFLLEKSSGEPINPNAKYFVLRYDAASKDEHARGVLLQYAEKSDFRDLRLDLIEEQNKCESK